MIPLSLLIPFHCLMKKQIFLSREGDGKTTHLFRARRRRRRHVRPSPHGIAIAKKRKINTHVANPQQKDNTINTIQAFISCRSQSNIPECGSKGICTYLVPAQARSNPKVIFFLSLSILSWHQQELHLI